MVKPSCASLPGSPDHESTATQSRGRAGRGEARAQGTPARSAPTSGLTAFLRFSTSSSSADGALVMASPGNTLSGLSGHEHAGYKRLSAGRCAALAQHWQGIFAHGPTWVECAPVDQRPGKVNLPPLHLLGVLLPRAAVGSDVALNGTALHVAARVSRARQRPCGERTDISFLSRSLRMARRTFLRSCPGLVMRPPDLAVRSRGPPPPPRPIVAVPPNTHGSLSLIVVKPLVEFVEAHVKSEGRGR